MNVAFAVGCASYDDEDINNLSFPQKDAATFAGTVTNSCGVKPDTLVLLSSDSDRRQLPTRNNILRELTSARSRSTRLTERVDNLFFFFSGHGFHSIQRNADYLIPQDGVAASLEESALGIDAIIGYLREWNAKHTVLFLDACRAGIAGGKAASTIHPVNQESVTVQGMAVFWSCSPGQKSYESAREESGVFTVGLKRGLSEEGKCKTIYELDGYLRKHVPALSKELALPIQDPFSRVEPIHLQDTILISQETFESWQALGVIGKEIRSREIPLEEETFGPGEVIFGIDFGTKHSAIAGADRNGNPVFVPSPEGKTLVPSVVSVLPNLDYLVGWRAIQHGSLNPDSTFYNIKRWLGTSKVFNAAGKSFGAEYLSSLIIKSLRTNAEEFSGRRVDSVIASAPANFTIRQCNALLKACQLAGLSVRRLISEPSAAAVIVTRDSVRSSKAWETVFVIDLGGGTLDISVIEVSEGVWEIKSAGGDRNLGGLDYDEAVYRYVLSIAASKVENDGHPFSDVELFQMRREAERAKISLSTREETSVLVQDLEVPGKGLASIDIPISRGLFRALSEELDRQVEYCILDALKRSLGRKREIVSVWCTGQGSKIFTVRELIGRVFPEIPIVTEYQENAVALGLGRYSGVLRGVNMIDLLLDAMPTAIGIKCLTTIDSLDDFGKRLMNESRVWNFSISTDANKNSQTHILIPRDTTLPTKRRSRGTVVDQAATLAITFVEIDLTGEEISLGEFAVEETTSSLELVADVDENRTITINALFQDRSIGVFQLNNFT